MRHPNDGTLRRLCDEAMAVPAAQRNHVKTCDRCRERADEIQQASLYAATTLGDRRPEVNAMRALVNVQARLASEPSVSVRRRTGEQVRRGMKRLTTPLLATGAGLAVLAGLTLTPAGSLAQHALDVFQPAQIAAVPVTNTDLQSLPRLRAFGTIRIARNTQAQTVTTAAQASSLAGMAVLTPASLPAGTPSTVRYHVMQPQTGSFTFDAAKARAAISRTGKPFPPMPGDMNGSVLRVKIGATVLAIYGTPSRIPALVIGQMRAPVISSRGASVAEMEQYVLHLPGVSPSLARSIEALGDPTQSATLPVPIPVNMAMAQSVQVQGVKGLAVGDSTGIGSVVVWEKGGIIYGVGGTMTESDALSVANSLK